MRWILASSSPRRKDLLEKAGLKIEIFSPQVDESEIRGELPAKMVRRLAKLKAEAVRNQLPGLKNAVIIAADTTVVEPTGKKILGKPLTTDEAIKMVSKIAGRTHTVLTGYCLVVVNSRGKSTTLTRVVKSFVTMKKLSSIQIKAYVSRGESMDKAGAYAAQGMGASFIDSIKGSYSNVVGLPVSQVLTDLEEKFGITVLFGK